MSEYKRLTNKNWKEHYDIFSDICCDVCKDDCGQCERNFNAMKRLAELEDKIESGELGDINVELHEQFDDIISKAIKIYEEFLKHCEKYKMCDECPYVISNEATNGVECHILFTLKYLSEEHNNE